MPSIACITPCSFPSPCDPPQCSPCVGPTGPTGPSPLGQVAFTVNSLSLPITFPANPNPNIGLVPLNYVQPGGIGAEAWNKTTGVFTAPRSGQYLISPALVFRNLDGASGQQAIVQLFLSNANGQRILAQKQNLVSPYGAAPFNGCESVAWSQVVYLSAGDSIQLLAGAVLSAGLGFQLIFGTYPVLETGLSITSLF